MKNNNCFYLVNKVLHNRGLLKIYKKKGLSFVSSLTDTGSQESLVHDPEKM